MSWSPYLADLVFKGKRFARNPPSGVPLVRADHFESVFFRRDGGICVFYGLGRSKKDLTLWWRCQWGLWKGLTADERASITMSVLKKHEAGKEGKIPTVAKDPAFVKKWPGLWEHLTCTTYPGTTDERKTSTVSIFLGTQGLTGSLNDRDNQRSCFGCGATLEGVLDALESACGDDTTVWRADKNLTGASGRKK